MGSTFFLIRERIFSYLSKGTIRRSRNGKEDRMILFSCARVVVEIASALVTLVSKFSKSLISCLWRSFHQGLRHFICRY